MRISSIGKKVGVAAGAAAAIGLTALAYTKGKKNLAEVDQFVNSKGIKKVGMALGDGFKAMGKTILAKVKEIPAKVKEIPSKVKGLFHKAEKLEEVAQ